MKPACETGWLATPRQWRGSAGVDLRMAVALWAKRGIIRFPHDPQDDGERSGGPQFGQLPFVKSSGGLFGFQEPWREVESQILLQGLDFRVVDFFEHGAGMTGLGRPVRVASPEIFIAGRMRAPSRNSWLKFSPIGHPCWARPFDFPPSQDA